MFKTHRTFELTTGVKNNTIAVLSTNNVVSVLYHKTVVVEYNYNTRTLKLDNGGWDTVSTRAVIANAIGQLGFKFQRNRKKENLILDNDGKLIAEFNGYLIVKPSKVGLKAIQIKTNREAA